MTEKPKDYWVRIGAVTLWAIVASVCGYRLWGWDGFWLITSLTGYLGGVVYIYVKGYQ